MTSSTFASKFPMTFPNDVATEIELAKQLNELVRFSSKISAENPHLEENKRRIEEEEEGSKKQEMDGEESGKSEIGVGAMESEEKRGHDEEGKSGRFDEVRLFVQRGRKDDRTEEDMISFDERESCENYVQSPEKSAIEMEKEYLPSRDVEGSISVMGRDGDIDEETDKFDESSVVNGDEMPVVNTNAGKEEEVEEKEIVDLINSDLRNQGNAADAEHQHAEYGLFTFILQKSSGEKWSLCFSSSHL